MRSSDAISSATRRAEELAPIRPTRQIFPASGPRPAPISMLKSSSSCLRTAASSTPVGHAHGVERPQPLAGRRQQREAEAVEAVGEHAMMPLVPRPARLEPFFLHDRQRLAQRVDERRRHRVVVLATDPVVLEQLQIEVEAAALDALASARGPNTTGARPDGAPRHFCVQL